MKQEKMPDPRRIMTILGLTIFLWLIAAAAVYGAWQFWKIHCSEPFLTLCGKIDATDPLICIAFLIAVLVIMATIELLKKKKT